MSRAALLPIGAIVLVLAGCGDDTQERAAELFAAGPDVEHLATFPFSADTLLPREADGVALADVITVRRADAMAADSGGDRSYLRYDVIGVAAATYNVGAIPVRVEMAQFAEPIEAYGWYSVHRPVGSQTEAIGRQSFQLGGKRYVYKGDYAVVLEAGDTTTAGRAALEQLGQEIADRITLEVRMAPYHMLFPSHDRVAASDRYYGYGFMDVERLNEVYTMDFASGVDTARWFLAPDTSGVKYLVFRQWAEAEGREMAVSATLQFDQGLGFYVEHPEFGGIIGGLVAEKLVGVIGYRPEKQERKFGSWLEGLGK